MNMTVEEIMSLYNNDNLRLDGYDPIINSLATEILKVIDVGEYQGDTFILLRNGDRYGYLCIGWGSCSGCDALQACETWQDVADLRNQLFDEIIWRDSRYELLSWMENHDWEGDFIGKDGIAAVNKMIKEFSKE